MFKSYTINKGEWQLSNYEHFICCFYEHILWNFCRFQRTFLTNNLLPFFRILTILPCSELLATIKMITQICGSRFCWTSVGLLTIYSCTSICYGFLQLFWNETIRRILGLVRVLFYSVPDSLQVVVFVCFFDQTLEFETLLLHHLLLCLQCLEKVMMMTSTNKTKSKWVQYVFSFSD